MNQAKYNNYITLLKKEVKPAIGCTEPIAVAYAAAKARQALNANPKIIEVTVSSNVLKNGMGVGIPGTGMIGLHIAAALGAVGGDPDAELEVLKNISKEDVGISKEMVKDQKVVITSKDMIDNIFIEVVCKRDREFGRAIIAKDHTNIILIDSHEKIYLKNDATNFDLNGSITFSKEELIDDFAKKLTVKDIFKFIQKVNLEDVEFLMNGAEMNDIIAHEGLENDFGLKVGKVIAENVKKGLLKDDISTHLMSLAAAASDARMAGSMTPVMSNSGSGNQGITVTVPIYSMAERLGTDREKLLRALTLGNLIAIHMKQFTGKLSALCGVISAATGATTGITYLMGGSLKNINFAIKNMIGNIAGMICDGAKAGCAMKVSTSVSAAFQAALLAMNEIEISEHDGIIEKDIEKTIKNLGMLGSNGMKETDRVILDIMTHK